MKAKLYYSKYSLTELSAMCDKNIGGLCKVMEGVRRPCVESAHILATALGMHVLFFLAPGWYDSDGTELPLEQRGQTRAWKYKGHAVSKKYRKLLAEKS